MNNMRPLTRAEYLVAKVMAGRPSNYRESAREPPYVQPDSGPARQHPRVFLPVYPFRQT
jgi:hypothetical protein